MGRILVFCVRVFAFRVVVNGAIESGGNRSKAA